MVQNTLTASLQRGKTPPTSVLDMAQKKFDGKAPVMLELWGMRIISSLPSLPGPLWPVVVASDAVISMVQIELICVITLN